MTWFFIPLLFLALFVPAQSHALDQPQLSIAMHGSPKYASDFVHFDYVNPDAPKGGILKLAATGSFDSLNPFIIRGHPAQGLNTGTLSLIYEPLMARSWDEPFSLYPLIAESIDVPADRSSITFNLNPKAHFSDSVPITSDDVLFSFITLRDKGRPNHRTFYKKVARVDKLSDHKIKFTFNANPDGTFDYEMPLIMALLPILPQHDWVDRDFNQTTLHIPVGSGPYKLTALDPGHFVTYTRDTNYWGRDLPSEIGLYNFDTIRIDYYRDDGISLEAFKAGQYDLRRESNPMIWATSYDFPAVHDGRVKLETLTHKRTEPASGFVFNTRRTPFNDPAFRAALEYSFDFDWINATLFHSQYHRTESFFPNSELTAPPLPEGKELEILNNYRPQLPSDIFTTPVTPPKGDPRTNLLRASTILREAGYTLTNDQLYAPHSTQPISFKIILSDPSEEKIALTWSHALKRLGITVSIQTLDTAQYQSRLAMFDFDVTTGKWINTLSPGNEQISFWGSTAADQPGSRNYAGIKDPIIDVLASSISIAKTREDLIASVHALDRVLMSGHYTIPFYYQGTDTIASWSYLHHPTTMPLYGMIIEAWWLQ